MGTVSVEEQMFWCYGLYMVMALANFGRTFDGAFGGDKTNTLVDLNPGFEKSHIPNRLTEILFVYFPDYRKHPI